MSEEWNNKLKKALMNENYTVAFDELMEKTLPPNLSVCAYRPTPHDKFSLGILIKFQPQCAYQDRSVCFLGVNGIMEEICVDLLEVSGEDYIISDDINFFTDMDENLIVLDDKCKDLVQATQTLKHLTREGNQVLEEL